MIVLLLLDANDQVLKIRFLVSLGPHYFHQLVFYHKGAALRTTKLVTQNVYDEHMTSSYNIKNYLLAN